MGAAAAAPVGLPVLLACIWLRVASIWLPAHCQLLVLAPQPLALLLEPA